MKQFAQVNKAKLSGRARSRCIRKTMLFLLYQVSKDRIFHTIVKKKISQAAQNMVVPIYRTEIN